MRHRDTIEALVAVDAGGDNREGDPEVRGGDEEDADHRRPGDVASGIAKLGREVRDRLPAEEREEEQDGSMRDGSGPVGEERAQVSGVLVRDRSNRGHEQDPGHGGRERELQPRAHTQPAKIRRHRDRQHRRRNGIGGGAARAERVGGVVRPRQRHQGLGDRGGEEVEPTDHRTCGAAERTRGEDRDAACVREARRERGERERDGHAERTVEEPGEQRRGPGAVGGDAREDEHAGADDRTAVERDCLRQADGRCETRDAQRLPPCRQPPPLD